jgi:thiol-disulfide isomerase/thioredoxin
MADAAAAKAKGQGLDVLPFPVVGESYAFHLKDVTGNLIDSRELRGKVVLLDFWATWCLPCMQKLPNLKELYARWHDEGFEVVGINFDDGQATLAKTVEELSLPWPQTMGPTDEELRHLWWKAMGLGALPRLLLIDRSGVLRADCRPDELEKHITAAMTEKKLPEDP